MEAVKQYLAIALLITLGSAHYVYQQIVKGFNIIKPVLKSFLIGITVTLIDWWSWVKVHALCAFHNALINYAPRYEYAAFVDNYNAEIEPLIKSRLEFVSKVQNDLENKFIIWLKTKNKLSDNTCRNYNNRLKNKIPESWCRELSR